MTYEAVIGLEVHAQLRTNSKIFCGCSTAFGASPNTQVCPVCLGMPGVLPVLNRRAVEYAVKMALAVGGRIAPASRFARKNYFYPDLPKGYQISQYERAGEPLSSGGSVEVVLDGETRRIRLRRIHLEEEAGKSIHDEPGYDPEDSYIDFNRTGVPLIEIVSEPDLRAPQEATAYLTRLRQVLQYTEVCDGNMEEGSLRCDANVSVRRPGEPAGQLIEVKNLNSIRGVERALEYEIQRQSAARERGEPIVRETRMWDESGRQTVPMRSKEQAHDYRYFPDPDLVTVEVDPAWIEDIRASLPELPAARERRFVEQYDLAGTSARILIETRERADYFEECVRLYNDPRTVSNWVLSEVLRVQNEQRLDLAVFQTRVSPASLAGLLAHIQSGHINGKIAKEVLDEMARTGMAASAIIQDRGLAQITDTGELDAVIAQMIDANPKELSDYRAGKTKLFGFFVGEVMKATKGKANPTLVNELLRARLS